MPGRIELFGDMKTWVFEEAAPLLLRSDQTPETVSIHPQQKSKDHRDFPDRALKDPLSGRILGEMRSSATMRTKIGLPCLTRGPVEPTGGIRPQARLVLEDKHCLLLMQRLKFQASGLKGL